MPVTRFLPVFISIAVSVGLWPLGISLMPQEGRGEYAVLVYRGDSHDREIRERLENQGFSGLVSESNQKILLDSFGSMEQVSLDEYDSRVLSFDPRNDGYAEKLHSLFVQDNRHFIYIPLKFASSAHLAMMEKRLAVSLADIAYSFEYETASRPTGLYCAVFCLAAAAFFIIRPLRRSVQHQKTSLLPCLPALAPLALGGAAGFAMASLLAGFAVLLVAFLEQFSLPYYREWHRVLYRLLLSLFLSCYGFIAFYSGLPLVFSLLVLAVFCGILAFSLRGTSGNAGLLFNRQKAHQRFYPVLILKRRLSGFAFAGAMVPFAAFALVLAISGNAATGTEMVMELPAAAVSEEDYHAHYLFQSNFSQRALHSPSGYTPEKTGMSMYELDSDGLLGSITIDDMASISLSGIPPFPLKDLLAFLNKSPRSTGLPYNLFTVFLPFLFIIPALMMRFFSGKGWIGVRRNEESQRIPIDRFLRINGA